MDTTQILTEYLKQVLLNPQGASLDMDVIQENRQFAENLKEFCEAVIEGYLFSAALADGELEKEFDGRNPFIGCLKELQAGLRHFSWQIQSVAAGDFTHRAEFLGKFSDEFNEMTQQLVQRRELLIQNHKLELKLERREREMLTQQLEQQKVYYRSLSDINKKLQVFQHDTKNHYLCLDSLLEQGDTAQVHEYLDSISVAVSHNVKIINTENCILDALLTEKILVAEAAGIQVKQSISIRPQVKVDNFDWSPLIGNAMDNAIEACEMLDESQEKYIKIRIRTYHNMMNVAIKNSSNPPQRDMSGKIISSKADSENHGFGLQNIHSTVEKYEGVMQTQYKDGYFILSFMLCDV